MPIASGANSVASALGNRRRDPGTAMRTYYEGLKPTRKTGTFYFGGNRNFLLWSDRQDCHGFPAPFAGNALAVLSVPGPSSLAAGLTSVPRQRAQQRFRQHRAHSGPRAGRARFGDDRSGGSTDPGAFLSPNPRGRLRK